MPFDRLALMAPCDGLADFPGYMRGSDAERLLAGWTTLWRPPLLVAAGRLPEIVSRYDPPEPTTLANTLLLVPPREEADEELCEWIDDVREAHTQPGLVVYQFANRDEIIANLAAPSPEDAAAELEPSDPVCEAQMFALGYAYLQTAMLAPDLVYGSLFEPSQFESRVLSAAKAAMADDRSELDRHLRACYDLLEQARSHTYPSEVSLLDVTLLAETTLGESLRDDMRSLGAEGRKTNLLASGALIQRLAAEHSDSLTAVRDALERGDASIVISGYDGQDISLLPPEAMLDSLAQSIVACERHLGVRPVAFGQFASALPPRLPSLLEHLGLEGVLLTGFDGGDVVASSHGRTAWIGIDGAHAEAALAMPRDVARPETMLGHYEALSMTLQRDHAATVLLAGWPGKRHAAFDDLVAVTRQSTVLGKFETLGDYYAHSAADDHWCPITDDHLGPAKWRSPAADESDKAKAPLAKQLVHLATGKSDASAPAESLATYLGYAIDNESASRLIVNATSSAKPSTAGPKSVPPLGYAVVTSPEKSDPPRAVGNVLRNEVMEVTISEETGGLRSLRTHDRRTNRLSQRLGVDKVNEPGMRCERIETTASAEAGGITSHGVLARYGAPLARFTQAFTLGAYADHLLLDIRIEFTGRAAPPLVCQWALGAAALDWRRGVQSANLKAHRRVFVASSFARSETATGSLTLAHASPMRHRCGERRAVTELPAVEASAIHARFAIGIDLRNAASLPLAVFAETRETCVALRDQAGSLSDSSAWWIHIGASNVVVSRIDPVDEGVVLHLLETEGRAAKCPVRTFRPAKSARLVSLNPSPQRELREKLPVSEGVVQLEIGPYGWLAVTIAW